MQLLKHWLTPPLLATLLWLGLIAGEVGIHPGTAGATTLDQALVAYLPPGNAITDGQALLRYSLPIDSKDLRKIQEDLEGLSQWLRSKRWAPMRGDVQKVDRLLSRRREAILDTVSAADRDRASTLLDDLQAGLIPMFEAIENRDKSAVQRLRKSLLQTIGSLEALMVAEFPFEVPAEYSMLPQLKGRATVAFETTKGTVTAIVDGYSAPVTAGNFVDLVQRGFYDHLPFIRAEDNYVLQTGDPVGPDEGFIDPKTGEYRSIPLEILVKGETEPVYGNTLESLGRYLEQPVLPFSAFGALGMARPESEPNGGSSQFFFFLFEPELTPAGLNLLDGRYAVFGYVVEGKEVLEKLSQEDSIESARVVTGLENLVQPQGV
ncbi:peptidylprolyl isomerase [Leptolyngbya sp. PCC 6406]|uniref:peptidylprolyl isomerase n=1 Tax=Leptolyngbya sp. PCC 6406 TaxID=1173264 RepID=UPI0002ABF494|nr:peptidylprolyl isomerase [Leptolyngbya sp. PCC 6406]